MANHSYRLIKQFILSDAFDSIPPEWAIFHHDRWWMATHTDDGIPIIPMYSMDGLQIGWLIGHGIDTHHKIIAQKFILPVQTTAVCIEDVENHLYQLAGRWAVVLLAGDVARFYVDPGAAVSAVYCPQQHIVASTMALIPLQDCSNQDKELVKLLDIPAKDNWYPFGLTSRLDVNRVLPNHYVDLHSWHLIRHWPHRQPVFVSQEQISDLTEKIASRIEDTITAVVRHGPTIMDLTGGRDSRTLLACARNVHREMRFSTARIPDRSAKRDCDIASRIAREHGLSHVTFEWLEASEQEIEEWLYRTGWCVGGRSMKGVRTFKQGGNAQTITINGIMTGVGRALYWKNGDEEFSRLFTTDLVQRMRLPLADRIIERGDQWLDGVPCENAFTILDLLALEQRVGCWASPQLYGHVGQLFTVYPFNHRDIIDAMIHLPIQYRLQQQLAPDLIKHKWPELVRYPFNRYPGIQGVMEVAKTRFTRVTKKLVGGYRNRRHHR